MRYVIISISLIFCASQPLFATPKDPYLVGKSFKDCAHCPEMVVVPAGRFMMGSPDTENGRDKDEGPRREVTIAKKFAVGKFEVTNREYVQFLNSVKRRGSKSKPWFKTNSKARYSQITGSVGQFKVKSGKDNFPVVNVSWYGAKAYADWLSKQTGQSYRLPSEAEWEYVARAGTDTAFWWGNSISTRQANYNGNFTYNNGPKGNYREKTVEVDSFEANGFGLKNVHGNVWEWTEDCYKNTYKGAPRDGSIWKSGNCDIRVLRDGSWFNDPHTLRSADRSGGNADVRYFSFGFRVTRTLR